MWIIIGRYFSKNNKDMLNTILPNNNIILDFLRNGDIECSIFSRKLAFFIKLNLILNRKQVLLLMLFSWNKSIIMKSSEIY